MEIQEQLTKQVFEKYVPGAKMPERNDSVYNRLKGQFCLSYDRLVETVIGGDRFVTDFESDEANKEQVLRYVAIDTFVGQARSLDLVLTATGFGIVSTDSTAPASQQRVDVLIAQERLELLTVRALITSSLRHLTGWPETIQAQALIRCLLWHPESVWPYVTIRPSVENWQVVTGRLTEAENVIRVKGLGDEYMDELIQKTRAVALDNADIIAADKCKRFMLDFVNRYDADKPVQQVNKYLLDTIVSEVESYPDCYPTYKESQLYKARHSERYENKREDPTFFLM